MATDRETTAKERYEALVTDRNSAESRARNCANVTIPALFVDPKQKGNNSTRTPVQGTGARCVNAFANSLLLAVLPPNITPITLRPDPAESEAIQEAAGIQKGELESALSEIERAMMDEIEAGARLRAVIAEGLKHTTAIGSWLIYIPDEGPSKLYPLTTFVVDRDGLGNVLEMVTLDLIALRMLPQEVQNRILQDTPESEQQNKLSEDVELYTHIHRNEANDAWECYQEVEGEVVPGTEGSYPIDACPWLPVALPRPVGESYARPIVEDYRGEFETLEALRKALRKGAAAAAKVLWLLKPESTMRPEQLSRAKSGDFVRGKRTDIEALTLDKVWDFRFVRDEADTTARNLELVFGVGTAIQRSGERVTREEIVHMARTLEDSRAGIYATAGEELLLPIARRILHRMQDLGQIPQLPEGLIKPRISVGIAALGRGHDFEKLVRFGETAKQVLGESEFSRRVDAGEWLSRLGAAADISTKGLVLEPEQVEQNDQQGAMQEAAVRAAPQLAGAVLPPDQMGTP